MKTAGILMLFGLCVLIGMRLAAGKKARYEDLCAIMRELRMFLDAIDAGQNSLALIAERNQGIWFNMLKTYLKARSEGQSETEAAETATEAWSGTTEEKTAMQSFFNGLSSSSATALRQRVRTLNTLLEETSKEAAETAKQAKTIRIVSVLIGAGIGILLL